MMKQHLSLKSVHWRFLSALLATALLAGCSSQTSATPLPPTALPPASAPVETPAPLDRAVPATVAAPPSETQGYPVVESDTGFVMAQVDVPIYDAPLESGTEIGFIAGGQMARVTGASADGMWWRVVCPDDTVGDCWVSAATEMTMPSSPPQ